MQKQKKNVAALFALLLALVMFSSVLFISAEANHDCINDDCPICCQIQSCEKLLLNISAAAAAICLAAIISFTADTLSAYNSAPFQRITLVNLKVKLSN